MNRLGQQLGRGEYQKFRNPNAAFANGLLWNPLNVSTALWLLLRSERRAAPA